MSVRSFLPLDAVRIFALFVASAGAGIGSLGARPSSNEYTVRSSASSRRTRRHMMFAAVTLVACCAQVDAADQVVSDLGDNGGANQFRQKLAACISTGGGTVTFSVSGTITLTQGTLSAMNSTATPVTIDGGSAITIAGTGTTNVRVFTINSGATVTLKNLTLSSALYPDDGGAVHNRGTLTVENCRFFDNRTPANFSGGAICTYGTLTVTNSEFGANKGGGGGAIYPRFGAAVVNITGCSFHDNEAINTTGGGLGGAVLLWDGPDVTINNSSFSNNKAHSSGGAIHVLANSKLRLNNCTLSDNSVTATSGLGGGITNAGTMDLTDVRLSGNSTKAQGTSAGGGGGIRNTGTGTLNAVTLNANRLEVGGHGGGIWNSGTCALTNSTLSENSAPSNYPGYSGYGGGIYSNAGTLTLLNVTLSGNSGGTGATGSGPAGQGGGVFIEGGSAVVTNSAFAKGATGVNCLGFTGGLGNLSDDATCGFGAGRDGANLMLAPLANNGGLTPTHALLSGSDAINAGNDWNAPSVDQRSYSRVGVSDVGAFEFGSQPFAITSIVRSGSDVIVSFPGFGGETYQLQRKLQLTPDTAWGPVGNTVTPTATRPVQMSDTGGANLSRAFYRVVTVP